MRVPTDPTENSSFFGQSNNIKIRGNHESQKHFDIPEDGITSKGHMTGPGRHIFSQGDIRKCVDKCHITNI